MSHVKSQCEISFLLLDLSKFLICISSFASNSSNRQFLFCHCLFFPSSYSMFVRFGLFLQEGSGSRSIFFFAQLPPRLYASHIGSVYPFLHLTLSTLFNPPSRMRECKCDNTKVSYEHTLPVRGEGKKVNVTIVVCLLLCMATGGRKKFGIQHFGLCKWYKIFLEFFRV